jgi:hypothetical protein
VTEPSREVPKGSWEPLSTRIGGSLRQAQRAVLRRVFPASAVVQGPRAARIQALGHDHKTGAHIIAVEGRIRHRSGATLSRRDS